LEDRSVCKQFLNKFVTKRTESTNISKMIFKILIFVTAIVLVSSEDQFGISSAFLHIATPPKQVAFNNLGEYSKHLLCIFG